MINPILLEQLRPLLLAHATPVYLVGGAVRDMIGGNPVHDLDFAVEYGAIALAFRVGNALGTPAYILDEEREVGRVVLGDTTLDFARFRHPEGGLAADLQDRDFTINSLAFLIGPTDGELIDLCGGIADLAAKRLRPTHPLAISNDPIRALRGIRFAVKYQLTFTDEAVRQIKAAAHCLENCSVERYRDELTNLLMLDHPAEAFVLLQKYQLLDTLLPELADTEQVDQSPPHHEAVGPHSRSTLQRWVEMEREIMADHWSLGKPYLAFLRDHLARPIEGDLTGRQLLRWAAILHDIGKTVTQTRDETGRLRFFEHEAVGAKMAEKRLRQLKFSNSAIKQMVLIIAEHMRPHQLSQQTTLTRRAAYRYYRALAANGLDVGLLALADTFAKTKTENSEYLHEASIVWQLFSEYIDHYDETISPPPLLTGDEMMAVLQLPPGPKIGQLIAELREAQAVGDITHREAAINFIVNRL